MQTGREREEGEVTVGARDCRSPPRPQVPSKPTHWAVSLAKDQPTWWRRVLERFQARSVLLYSLMIRALAKF